MHSHFQINKHGGLLRSSGRCGAAVVQSRFNLDPLRRPLIYPSPSDTCNPKRRTDAFVRICDVLGIDARERKNPFISVRSMRRRNYFLQTCILLVSAISIFQPGTDRPPAANGRLLPS